MKFENHYCSDIEPWCQKLYAQRFPDSIQLGDITKIDAEDLPAGEWIISGGFPCQDISIAGKGAGIHGERSGLWFEYWRLIRDLRPQFAIMENVGMLVHRGLRDVLGSLAEIGYDAEWQDIRASDVGAPHKRERIWIVAYPERRGWGSWRTECEGQRRSITPNGAGCEKFSTEWIKCEHCGESSPKYSWEFENWQCPDCGNVPHPSLQLSHGSGEARRGRGELTDGGDVADAEIRGQSMRRGSSRESGHAALGGEIMAHPTSTGCETMWDAGKLITKNADQCGVSDWWSTEPSVRGMVDGLPAELHGYEGRLAVKPHQRVDRLRGLGNAIVPQIAEILFRQIKELL